jgi:hypothetical protein
VSVTAGGATLTVKEDWLFVLMRLSLRGVEPPLGYASNVIVPVAALL